MNFVGVLGLIVAGGIAVWELKRRMDPARDDPATQPGPAERGAVGPRGTRPAARYAVAAGPDASGFPASVHGVHSTSIA